MDKRRLNEEIRMLRLVDPKARPYLFGKEMGHQEFATLLDFVSTIAESMWQKNDILEKPHTKQELQNMCMCSAKWALEEFTTRLPATKGIIKT